MTTPQLEPDSAYLRAKTRAVRVSQIITGVLLLTGVTVIVVSAIGLSTANDALAAATANHNAGTAQVSASQDAEAQGQRDKKNAHDQMMAQTTTVMDLYNNSFATGTAYNRKLASAMTAYDHASAALTKLQDDVTVTESNEVLLGILVEGSQVNAAAAGVELAGVTIGSIIIVLLAAATTYGFAISASKARATHAQPSPGAVTGP